MPLRIVVPTTGAAATEITVQEDDVNVATEVSTLNFEGGGGKVVDDGGNKVTIDITGGGGGGLYESYCHVRDEKAQNTAGGTFTSGDWRTRVINTEVSDPDGICAIASNQITLAAGTYRCLIVAPAAACDRHQARLRNVTGGATLVLGGSIFAQTTDNAENHSFVQGRFTVAAGQALEVQHQCETTHATNGFGVEANFGTEVYTQAEFWKET